MKMQLLCLLGVSLGFFLGGCAADEPASANNPYGLEPAGGYAHGEASAMYGHSVGH